MHKHYGVKGERYKLMYFYQDKVWELYDLKNDPTEMHNIYGQKGTEKITAKLKKELAKLQQQYEVLSVAWNNHFMTLKFRKI